jgi:hypothetical protein
MIGGLDGCSDLEMLFETLKRSITQLQVVVASLEIDIMTPLPRLQLD